MIRRFFITRSLLAHIAKAHTRNNKTDKLIASVATPLGCNQRRSIIPATQRSGPLISNA